MISPVTLLRSALLASLLAHGAMAGDAVMWNPAKRDFITEYSSTPPGGKDYLNEEQAAESVEKLMRKQHALEPVMVWKSDRTGYFTVWTGVTAAKKIVAAVGFGPTENEAKVDGLGAVRKLGAEKDFLIAYRYSSYGQDHAPNAPPLEDLSTSAVVNEEITSFSPDGHLALRTAHSRGWKFRRFDLVDLQNFQLLLELGTPTVLFGSIVWSQDSQRFAFFGEEQSYGDTTVYFHEDGKYVPVALPERAQFPEPEFGLEPGERLFKTSNDVVRPRAWLNSGDLQLEHTVDVVVEKSYEQVATVEATTKLTIHFDEGRNATIIAVAQEAARKAIPPKPKRVFPNVAGEVGKKPDK